MAAIAKEIDVPRPTFNRQVLEQSIPARTLIDIARTYNLSILALLTALGLISLDEARAAAEVRGLDEYTTAELSKEVYERTARQLLAKHEARSGNIADLAGRRRPVTAADITEEDLMCEAAYTPEECETPDRDNYY